MTSSAKTRSGDEHRRCHKRASRCYTPKAADVILGRGKGAYQNEGNRRLQDLVAFYLPAYRAAKTNQEKINITTLIVESVKQNGGRFLSEKVKDGEIIEVCDQKARIKVAQAIRHQRRSSFVEETLSDYTHSSDVVYSCQDDGLTCTSSRDPTKPRWSESPDPYLNSEWDDASREKEATRPTEKSKQVARRPVADGWEEPTNIGVVNKDGEVAGFEPIEKGDRFAEGALFAPLGPCHNSEWDDASREKERHCFSTKKSKQKANPRPQAEGNEDEATNPNVTNKDAELKGYELTERDRCAGEALFALSVEAVFVTVLRSERTRKESLAACDDPDDVSEFTLVEFEEADCCTSSLPIS
ncbi:hypothetical protein ACA910_017811 [Epithemia clementina (nom. ined.)]